MLGPTDTAALLEVTIHCSAALALHELKALQLLSQVPELITVDCLCESEFTALTTEVGGRRTRGKHQLCCVILQLVSVGELDANRSTVDVSDRARITIPI